MTLLNRDQLPLTALPAAGGSIEQLLAYSSAAYRFHTLASERIQLVDASGAVISYRPCTVAPVETVDKQLMLMIQAVVPLIADPYNSGSNSVWEDVIVLPSSSVITEGYTA